MVSLNWSLLQDGAGVSFARRSGRSAGQIATHVARMWTVILGELVVNCLDASGRVENGEARRVLNAGCSSLNDIGGEVGVFASGTG